ncbi:MAG TPA: hypothetical protein PJ990_06320 [Saprospiraceae bacterium]|nr:hypothetical protein [Saprospiraceae bacterium]
MKTSYKEIKTDRQWKSATGVSKKQFEILSDLFKAEYHLLFGKTKEENNLESPQQVQIESETDLLFILLFSLKTGMTEDVLGLVFGMERSTFSKNRAIALKVLVCTLQRIGMLPRREFKDIEAFEEYMKTHPELLIDGTENQIQRPHNQTVQKDYYSGKKNAIR